VKDDPLAILLCALTGCGFCALACGFVWLATCLLILLS
jgi:hypothetical protein